MDKNCLQIFAQTEPLYPTRLFFDKKIIPLGFLVEKINLNRF